MRYPSVVSAAPIERLLQQLRNDVANLRQLDPSSHALPSMERQVKLLAQALEEATREDVRLTVEEVSVIEKLSPQVIRRRLKQGLYSGAERRGGEWRIPRTAVAA